MRNSNIALVFSFSIEFLQLYHAPWIDQIRMTTMGGLVLGYGFKVSDLFCYAVGVMIGVAISQFISYCLEPKKIA